MPYVLISFWHVKEEKFSTASYGRTVTLRVDTRHEAVHNRR